MLLASGSSLDAGSRPVCPGPTPLHRHCPQRRAYPLQARSKRGTRSCPNSKPVRASGGSGSGRGTGTGSGDGGGEEDSGKRGARSTLIALLLLAGAAGAICLFSPLGSDTAEEDRSEEEFNDQTDKDTVQSADRQQASKSGSNSGVEVEEQQRQEGAMSQEQATQQYKSAQAHLESEQRARNQALARQQRQITELQQHLDTMSEHTQALKRLQREAFEQLVGVGSRVDALQEHAEEQARAAHPTLLPVGIPQHGEHDRPRVFLSGEVATAHCASNVQVLGDHNYVDEAASVRLPQSSSHFQARLQSSVLPGGRDQLQAVLRMPEAPKQSLNDRPFAGSSSGSSSGSGSSPAMLTKALYACKVNRMLQLLVAAVGAEPSDAAMTLDASHRMGLSPLAQQGNPSHSQSCGPCLAACLQRSRLTCTAMHFGSSAQQQEHHTLLQAAFAARGNLLLGLSALQRWSGSLLARSSAGSSASVSSASSEEGGLALIGQQTLSVSGSYSPNEDTAVSGWLALEPNPSSPPEFGLAVSGIPDETGASWVASVGRRRGGAHQLPTLMGELALNMPVTSGLFLTPSILLSQNEAARSMSIGLQSKWLM